MIRCNDCRYWSELMARGDGMYMTAMCLCPESVRYQEYTRVVEFCVHYASDHLGAIDNPHQDPLRYEADKKGGA